MTRIIAIGRMRSCFTLMNGGQTPTSWYGFSAECGLKAVMERLGMPSGTPGRYRRHIQELWPIFEDFAKNRDGGRYLDFFPDGEPFADWAPHDRYVYRERFSQVTVSPHREAAQRVRLMVGFGAQDEEP